MDRLRRGRALSIGFAMGQILHSLLSIVLGLVAVTTIGMFVNRCWIMGSMVCISGILLNHAACRWLTRGQ